jgi:hypothetical protein
MCIAARAWLSWGLYLKKYHNFEKKKKGGSKKKKGGSHAGFNSTKVL